MHQIFLQADLGLRQEAALGHIGQGAVGGIGQGQNRAVVHRVDLGLCRHNGREDIPALHTLFHRRTDVGREQHRTLAGAEELLHRVAGAAAHMDVKALELALKGGELLQVGAAVIGRGVHLLQGTEETAPALVQGFVDLHFTVSRHQTFSFHFRPQAITAKFRQSSLSGSPQ